MASQKISALTEKMSLAANDLFVIVDSVGIVNKKIKASNLSLFLKADGSIDSTGNQTFSDGITSKTGTVADLSITVGSVADGKGFYSVSSTQLGIAIGNALSVVVNTTGIAVAQIDELVGGGGIIFVGTGAFDFTGVDGIINLANTGGVNLSGAFGGIEVGGAATYTGTVAGAAAKSVVNGLIMD